MAYGIINIFWKYLAEDLPLIIVSFICMFLILQVYLPKTSQKRKWSTLFIIEGFEHLALPLILLITLIFTDSWITALLFHISLLSFLFIFLGLVVIKAKTREDWFRITAVAAWTYFFIFLYPFILISIQMYSPINGWWILGTTLALFGLFYFMFKQRFINYNELK
jgi:hypothetical protein